MDRRELLARAGSALCAISASSMLGGCRRPDDAVTQPSIELGVAPLPPAPPTSAVVTTTSTTVPAESSILAGWVARENRLTGTDAWRILDPTRPTERWRSDGMIEGYADTTTTRPGDTVVLRVQTPAAAWHVEVYRMGWYGGAGGRLVWTSDDLPGVPQLSDSFDRETRMVRARWKPMIEIPIGDDWLPGSYLCKLVSSTGAASYVPITVRRDDAPGGPLLVSAVTTWQAYNPWGGRSLYENFGPGDRLDRSRVVSFDRPYALSYAWGAADFLTHELPLIMLVEELGIDLGYATDIDLHTSEAEADDLLAGRTAVLTTGHDEYYSRAMRTTLERARDRGVNLAFFGANAVYRHIRLEESEEGLAHRQMVNYRTASADPLTESEPSQSTVQWRNAPLSAPENALIGVQYFAAGVTAPMRLVDTENWVFDGVDVSTQRTLRGLVAIEADGLGPASSEPDGLQVLASSPVSYRGVSYDHAMTYYSASSGAGVFATGTIGWIMALDEAMWDDPPVSSVVRDVTSNVLRTFAEGPSGREHPSSGTADAYRGSVGPADD
ncbi:MAG: N,N-dimethylformamidase beta subunit family domain-containing protein [Ilumatobacteraceae bacterium]